MLLVEQPRLPGDYLKNRCLLSLVDFSQTLLPLAVPRPAGQQPPIFHFSGDNIRSYLEFFPDTKNRTAAVGGFFADVTASGSPAACWAEVPNHIIRNYINKVLSGFSSRSGSTMSQGIQSSLVQTPHVDRPAQSSWLLRPYFRFVPVLNHHVSLNPDLISQISPKMSIGVGMIVAIIIPANASSSDAYLRCQSPSDKSSRVWTKYPMRLGWLCG